MSDFERLRRELRQEKLAREAVERENVQLRDKVDRLEKRVEELLQSQRRTEEFLQAQIRKLEKDVSDRDEKLEGAEKQLAWFRKIFFDKTSEQAPLSAEEVEERAPEIEEQPVAKRNRGQQPGSKGHGRTDHPRVQQEDQDVNIENCACNACGRAYRKLSRTENSPLIDLFTVLLLTNYRRSMYAPDCNCAGGKLITADPPAKLFSRTKLGNSVWVHLIVQKFLFGLPTHRTLNDLSLKGLPLSPGTVTDGFRRIEVLLEPLYARLMDHCRGGEYWSGDETTWRVFAAGQKKWWLWMIASDDTVVYLLDPSRSKRVPTDFFAGSVGILMTDRLSSYKGLHEGIKKAWCWVHVRRDFLNIFNGIKKLRPWARQWLEEIAKLFVLTDARFKLWNAGSNYGPKWTKAESMLLEHVQWMERRWQEELKQTGLHKEQKTALSSLKRHWDGLTLFVIDPRVPLHNNRAERLLRNAVILRKNSFGSGAEWSGRFAAKLFSLFQTWLINGLDPEALLLDFFNEASKPGRASPNVELFLPWKMSQSRKQEFDLPKSFKRPG